MNFIQVESLIHKLLDGVSSMLDVRSEGEFYEGSIPGAVNLPILRNEERHQVGLTYKNEGQDAAIRLGHLLVDPHREQRVAGWLAHLKGVVAENRFVYCWRGGLRSKMATDWIRDAGCPVLQVEGGYKAIRKVLIERIDSLSDESKPFLVVSGPTGSGKTELLRSGSFPVFDLEKHANHRGSTFGLAVNAVQPRQATFENALGLDLLGLDRKWNVENKGAFLIEDESAGIGKCWVPKPIQLKTANAPILIIDEQIESRAIRIEEEYVSLPLSNGVSADLLRAHLSSQLIKLEKKLGLERSLRIQNELKNSFSSDYSQGSHLGWIVLLLKEYYDPGYSFYFGKFNRNPVFKGSLLECREWIQHWMSMGRKLD